MSSAPSSSAPVIVIGGGISGLAAAYYLRKAGRPCLLVEPSPRLGGVITTEQVDGCVVEGGPDSFLASKPWALDLIRELNLDGEVISSNDHLRVTYVVKDGKLVPLPEGLMMMAPTRVWPVIASPLLSWSTKIRMALEYLRRPGPPRADRSVAEFVRDHYGQQAVDYLAEPLLAGVYGGDAEALSLRSTLERFAAIEERHGSLTRGLLAGERSNPGGGSIFRSLKGGMGQLVRALEPHVEQRIEAAAEAIGQGRVRVNGQWIEASRVIVAVPAHEASRLVQALDGGLASELARIPYNSAATMAFGFRRAGLDHPLNGFGFLVPNKERGPLVACTWVGTKFPHRTPATHALLAVLPLMARRKRTYWPSSAGS